LRSRESSGGVNGYDALPKALRFIAICRRTYSLYLYLLFKLVVGRLVKAAIRSAVCRNSQALYMHDGGALSSVHPCLKHPQSLVVATCTTPSASRSAGPRGQKQHHPEHARSLAIAWDCRARARLIEVRRKRYRWL
jgi:hypothetical protein